jgi:hypothetical protein
MARIGKPYSIMSAIACLQPLTINPKLALP